MEKVESKVKVYSKTGDYNFLKLGANLVWVFNVTPRPHYPRKEPVPFERMLVRPYGRSYVDLLYRCVLQFVIAYKVSSIIL
jgi:hypothetical protein